MMIKTKNRSISSSFRIADTRLTSKREKTEPLSLGEQIPIIWDKAIDFNVFDEDGNKWIDMTSGIFVTNSGHANTQVKDAIKQQLDNNLLFAYQYLTDIRDQFITKLLDMSPPHFDKVVILNSGSEAIDAMYRIIKGWSKNNSKRKRYIICFNGSYHGRVLGAALLCGSKSATNWSNMVDDDVIFIDFPYKETDTFDASVLPPPDQIAAFVIETYQGWGACMYPKQYLKDLDTFAKKHGALMCFDEIQSGFYSMGTLYGYQSYGDFLEPDLIALGKALSSCLPLAAVLGRKDIIDSDLTSNLSGTNAGNAICCAAAIGNLEFLSNPSFISSFQKRVQVFKDRCEKLSSLPNVKEINHRGMVAGIIMSSATVANVIVDKCVLNGVLPVKTFRESIKLGPPLTITADAIEEAFDVITSAIMEASHVK